MGGSNNYEPSKNFGNAPPRPELRHDPAISRMNRRSHQLNEGAARSGRYIPGHRLTYV